MEKLLIITREKLTYSEAPPSRILNIAETLKKYADVSIIAKSGSEEENRRATITLPSFGNTTAGRQIYKIVMTLMAAFFMAFKGTRYVMTREYYYLITLKPFSLIFRTKLIYDMHCFRYKELIEEQKPLKSRLIKPFEKLSHMFADTILAVSPGIFEDLDEKLKRKAILLQNGVALEEFRELLKKPLEESFIKKYGLTRRKEYVCFIGNWMPWVDVKTILEASRHLPNRTRIIIVGSPYTKTSIEELKKKYPKVIFTGRIPHEEAIKVLKISRAALLSYKKAEVTKHLSVRKTLEYLAAGVPIIMSDSDIYEKQYMKRGENYVLFRPSDAKSLASAITKLLSDKKLLRKMSENNRELSRKFSWESVVKRSGLPTILGVPGTIKDDTLLNSTITIIIKALNEEKYIASCIESALNATKDLKAEIILVDSASEDKTVEIASRYPIKIVRLKDKTERCCGIGPQIGYLISKSEFIYILDGDMLLDMNFIREALPYFADPLICGIGGNIEELSKDNLAFQVRYKDHTVEKPRIVKQLGMGGLYRRECIDKIGYFSNPYLKAYEEYDLAAKIEQTGKVLLRIPHRMVSHYGEEEGEFATLINRWKSGYIFGSGQYLRYSIRGKHFLRTLNELKIYFASLIWLIAGAGALITALWNPTPLAVYAIITASMTLWLWKRKNSFRQLVFSIFSYNFQAAGMLRGFLMKPRKISGFKAKIEIVKEWGKEK